MGIRKSTPPNTKTDQEMQGTPPTAIFKSAIVFQAGRGFFYSNIQTPLILKLFLLSLTSQTGPVLDPFQLHWLTASLYNTHAYTHAPAAVHTRPHGDADHSHLHCVCNLPHTNKKAFLLLNQGSAFPSWRYALLAATPLRPRCLCLFFNEFMSLHWCCHKSMRSTAHPSPSPALIGWSDGIKVRWLRVDDGIPPPC